MKIVKAKTTIENVFVVNQQFYVSTYLPGEQKQEQEVGLGCSKETCGRSVTLFTTVFRVNDIFGHKKSKKIGSSELYFSNVMVPLKKSIWKKKQLLNILSKRLS
jgi:hypothetical protein